MKARIKFRKHGALKFIGHLDVMRYFQKSMRRAGIPIAFTEGYSPHMIMSFASPLGIGLTSDGEYFDIELKEAIASKEAVRLLNEVMVEGMEVVSFRQIAEEKRMTGMALVAAADYLSTPVKGSLPEAWREKVDGFMGQPQIRILKATKRSEKEVDIKPMIYRLEPEGEGLFMELAAGSSENLKPGLVMEAFLRYVGAEPEKLRFQHHRLDLYADIGEGGQQKLVQLEKLGTEIEV